MKRISTLVAAVLAALALTVAVAPATASASTVLCESVVLEGKCPSGEVLPTDTWIRYGDRGIEDAEFLELDGGFFVDFKCESGVVGGYNTAEVGNPLPMKVALAPFHCRVNNGALCTSVSVNEPEGVLHATGNGNSILGLGRWFDPLIISFECKTAGGYDANCTYSGTASPPQLAILHNKSKNPVLPYEAESSGGEMVRTKGTGLCPTAVTLLLSAYSSSETHYPAPY